MEGHFIHLGLTHSEDDAITHLRNVGNYLPVRTVYKGARGGATNRKVAGSIPHGVIGIFH